MQSKVCSQPVVRKPSEVVPLPRSADLGRDLERLEREQREELDRRKQEQLARLRRLPDLD